MLRRRRLPRIEGLDPGERVLAAGEGPSGRVVATDRRLIMPGAQLGWEQVERASWDGDDDTLTVTETPAAGTPAAGTSALAERARRHRVTIAEPGRLIDVVREQVTGSVVIVRRVPVEGRRGVRVTGRRRFDGEILWTVALEAGLRLDDPDTRAGVDAAVAAVRAEVE